MESDLAQWAGHRERGLHLHRGFESGHPAWPIRGDPMTGHSMRSLQRRIGVRRIMAAMAVAALVFAGPAGAANIFEKVGTFDGQFLKIGVGARAEGMGGAFVGVADDATALFWNAAGIARIDPEKSELTLN